MTGPLNGHSVTEAPAPPNPAEDVARAVVAMMQAEGADQEPWEDLSDEHRESELYIAGLYLAAHLAWLTARGFKIVPPNATPLPTTQEEALAMVQAAKGFFDGQKRRGKLMGQVSPKLVVPGRPH